MSNRGERRKTSEIGESIILENDNIQIQNIEIVWCSNIVVLHNVVYSSYVTWDVGTHADHRKCRENLQRYRMEDRVDNRTTESHRCTMYCSSELQLHLPYTHTGENPA